MKQHDSRNDDLKELRQLFAEVNAHLAPSENVADTPGDENDPVADTAGSVTQERPATVFPSFPSELFLGVCLIQPAG